MIGKCEGFAPALIVYWVLFAWRLVGTQGVGMSSFNGNIMHKCQDGEFNSSKKSKENSINTYSLFNSWTKMEIRLALFMLSAWCNSGTIYLVVITLSPSRPRRIPAKWNIVQKVGHIPTCMSPEHFFMIKKLTILYLWIFVTRVSIMFNDNNVVIKDV